MRMVLESEISFRIVLMATHIQHTHVQMGFHVLYSCMSCQLHSISNDPREGSLVMIQIEEIILIPGPYFVIFMVIINIHISMNESYSLLLQHLSRQHY